ncbi:MAG: sugar phosphate isomerase/epimerase family protein [Clostridia bacterium]|nr:sugar phosphate isomerase/epimerase family protein [Clostridia bacterium]
MRDYSIHSWFGFELPMAERARLIKEAGFTSMMLWWSDEHQYPGDKKENHPDDIRKLGLRIENVHLPFISSNGIWKDNLEGDSTMALYDKCIDDCKRHMFPVAVMHPNRSIDPPEINELGIDRFRRLAEKAWEAGVVLALENVSRHHYTSRILDDVNSPGLGFCYDSGHDLLYSQKPYILPVKYKERLVAVHLHDNMMEKDEHRLPIEGMINLHALVDSIVEAGYEGPLSLEVANPKPGEEPLAYLKRAYGIATVLEKLRHYEY